VTLASLPLLERVRPADPTRLAALAPLDVLLLERLGAGTGRPALPEAALLGVLEVEADAASPERLAPLVLGPASRFGSDRALLLELAARIGAQSDALRWLQLRAPGEAFEALASRPVAVELLALGGRIVGGPWPPVLAEDGALLTRI
jgi:hypothetical protein